MLSQVNVVVGAFLLRQPRIGQPAEYDVQADKRPGWEQQRDHQSLAEHLR